MTYMWIDDQILENFESDICVKVFVPETQAVVLGSGNEVSKEVNVAACQTRGIPVLRRYGGGGTVVLYPGCVVVSVGCWVKEQFSNNLYFKMINQAVILSLASKWPALSALSQAGISDIVMGDRKIAGTSLFRSRNYLLYQASILVHMDALLIGNVLSHPSKEPDYRKGRRHSDFLTGLADVEKTVESPQLVADILERHLISRLNEEMTVHLISPMATQYKSLRDRLERARDQAEASKLT